MVGIIRLSIENNLFLWILEFVWEISGNFDIMTKHFISGRKNFGGKNYLLCFIYDAIRYYEIHNGIKGNTPNFIISFIMMK